MKRTKPKYQINLLNTLTGKVVKRPLDTTTTVGNIRCIFRKQLEVSDFSIYYFQTVCHDSQLITTIIENSRYHNWEKNQIGNFYFLVDNVSTEDFFQFRRYRFEILHPKKTFIRNKRRFISETISDLKKYFGQKKYFNYSKDPKFIMKVEILYKGIPLDDDIRLIYSGISSSESFQVRPVFPKEIQVILNDQIQLGIAIPNDSPHTVQKLKQILSTLKLSNTPSQNANLIIQYNGSVLPDNTDLNLFRLTNPNCNALEARTMTNYPQSLIQYTAQFRIGRTQNFLNVQLSSYRFSVNDVINKISKELSIDPSNVSLFKEKQPTSLNPNTIIEFTNSIDCSQYYIQLKLTLKFKSNDDKVKTKDKAIYGFPTYQMICQEVKSWRIQDNFSLFANSEIIQEQTDFLKIVRERIPINVVFVKRAISYFKMGTDAFQATLNTTSFVKAGKLFISKKCNVPVNSIRLIFKGNELNDDSLMTDVSSSEDCPIFVYVHRSLYDILTRAKASQTNSS